MILTLSFPPMPYFIACGEDTYTRGEKHSSRQPIGVFDLLLVTRGSLNISERGVLYEVKEGEALILRPDYAHFSHAPCLEETHFYWLHFQVSGTWSEALEDTPHTLRLEKNAYVPELTSIRLPRQSQLADPHLTYDRLRELLNLANHSSASARWEEQSIFQQVLRAFYEEGKTELYSPTFRLAEHAVSILRKNYRESINYAALGKELNFHPTYISRCVKQVFGCTLDYLIRFRLEQAKRLLINTDWPVSRIAEESGFENSAYFTRCFNRSQQTTPRDFRKKYR